MNYNFSRVEEIKRLKEEIADEQRKQSEYSQHMKKRGEIFCYIRTAFQHLMNALRHVGMEHVPDKKQYPDEDLNLPLLKFNAFVPKAKPPSPYEEDGKPTNIHCVSHCNIVYYHLTCYDNQMRSVSFDS